MTNNAAPKKNLVLNITSAPEPYIHPMICLLDFDAEVERQLIESRFNCVKASLGSAVKVNNRYQQSKIMKLNHDYPDNIHEFDVVMMDLTDINEVEYDASYHAVSNTSGSTAYALLSAYPEQIFDPRQLSIHFLSEEINQFPSKESILIAFCGQEITTEYKYLQITDRSSVVTKEKNHSNFSLYDKFPNTSSLTGRKVKLPKENNIFTPILSKYINDVEYRRVFDHPTYWDGKQMVKSDNLVPLLLNSRDQIVSFVHFVDKMTVLVFPNIFNKADFIADLFKSTLPELMPELFPFHGEFAWLDNGDYLLPGEAELRLERIRLEQKYVSDISDNESYMIELKEKYKFLSDMISETGDPLVSSIIMYLQWLGFDNVVDYDNTVSEIFEEDIQVDCGDRLLVIEVKGIGGTSTDKDCSQISKIKYRRSEQRGRFDVYGLYIVNHQRYMPPKSRSNPPFTENQIRDAKNDKRGLITTYDLFKSYFLIEQGILSKADVKEHLFETGLINLEPKNLKSLGFANELFQDGQILILQLDGVLLNVHDDLIIKKSGEYSKLTIDSIQVNDNSVLSCDSGEVGIKVNGKIKKNSEIFIFNE